VRLTVGSLPLPVKAPQDTESTPEDPDTNARIIAHLGFARAVASRALDPRCRGADREDLIAWGILGLVHERGGLLAPSGIANVLRGAARCDAVLTHPELMSSSFFAILRGRDYRALVCDVAAMRCKGYLATESRGRLVVTASGRDALAERQRTGG